MDIYLATNSAYKRSQISQFFIKAGLETVFLHSADAVGGMPEVEETENTYEGNARLKALALAKQCPKDSYVLSDDSGLEVEALYGAPGVHSARFAHAKANAKENNLLLLEKMSHLPIGSRRARFVACLFLLDIRSGEAFTFTGYYPGTIALSYPAKGDGKIGYMPIFIPEGEVEALAFLPPVILETLSHRAQAFQQLLKHIQKTKLA